MKQLIVTAFLIFISIMCYSQTGKWKKAQKTNTVESYKEFLANYPASEYADDALAKLTELEFTKAQSSNTIESYSYFLDNYGENAFSNRAKNKLIQLEFNKASKLKTVEAYRSFLERFPEGEYSEAAKLAVCAIEFNKIKRENSSDGYKHFINQYPNNQYTEKALELLAEKEFEKAEVTGTIDEYKLIIKNYPDTESARKAERNIEMKDEWEVVAAAPSLESYFEFQDKFPRSNLELTDQMLELIKANAIKTGKYFKVFDNPIIVDQSKDMPAGTEIPGAWIRNAIYEVMDNGMRFYAGYRLSVIDNGLSYIIHFYSSKNQPLIFLINEFVSSKSLSTHLQYKSGKGYVLVKEGRDLKIFDFNR